MSELTTGNWLNQYVAPQLLQEFKNYKDDFVGVLPGVPKQAITADGVRYNKLINNVGFYVDNTAEFTSKQMSGEKVFVEWEKYDTDPTEVNDAEIRSLGYDKRNEVRTKHAEAFKIGIRNHIMWKLAPADATASNMPVVRTTGSVINSRKRLTFADLVGYLETVKALNLPQEDQLFLILCPEHSTDLILDRDSAAYFANKDIFFDMQSGKVKSVMGFKFFENNNCPVYSSAGVKLAKGATKTSTDRNASLFFYAPNSLYHLESTKILYTPETSDVYSADPKSVFRTQTYGLIDRVVDYGFGAIVSAVDGVV
jgi:hypothetical protein